MSGNFDRRTRNFSKYDSMSTERLQEILRLDAHRTDGVEMDTDELFYIMEVLADRRRKDSSYTGKTVEQAYKTFRKHYLPEEEATSTSHKMIIMPAWMRRAVVVAAVLAILLTTTLSVDANGFNLWGRVAIWTEEFFRFEDETQVTRPSDPNMNNALDFSSLQDALDAHNISYRLAPTWLPFGYELTDIVVTESPKEISIYADYVNNDNRIRISIRQLIGTKPENTERSDSLVETYVANGVTYFIFFNNSKLQVAWVVEEFECIFGGALTIDEAKAMIDSI